MKIEEETIAISSSVSHAFVWKEYIWEKLLRSIYYSVL